MSTAVAGATRECPHCRATILASAAVCPQCRHHLRFDESAKRRGAATTTAFAVDGTFRQPADAGTAEYSVVVTVRDARGREVSRQVIGVGALHPDEERSFSLSVEVGNVRA